MRRGRSLARALTSLAFITRGCAGVLGLLVLWLAFDVIQSAPSVPGWSYLTDDLADVGRAGGVFPVILSTAVIISMAVAMALPLAFAVAALHAEVLRSRPRWAQAISATVNVQVGFPSVVIGLIGVELFVVRCNLGHSLIAGALTLTLVLAPVMAAAFIAGFDSVGYRVREQALCLGLTRWRVFVSCMVPAAWPALLAGVVLSVGRAFAETAAVLLTSGISTRTPESLLDPGATLSVHVYQLTMSVPGGQARAYMAAMLLIFIALGTQLAIERLRRRRNR